MTRRITNHDRAMAWRRGMKNLRAAAKLAAEKARTMRGIPNEIDHAEGHAGGLEEAIEIMMNAARSARPR